MHPIEIRQDLERAACEWAERQIAICGRNTVKAQFLSTVVRQGLAHATAHGLADWKMIDIMQEAVCLFDDLALADVTADKHKPLTSAGWSHQDVWKAFNQGLGARLHYEFHRSELESIAARLLALEWLEMPYLEWAIVDCLVYNEIVQFGDAIQTDWPGPKTLGANTQFMIGHDFAAIQRAEWIWKLKIGAVTYGVWYLVAPAVVAAIFSSGWVKVALVMGAIWGLLTLLPLAFLFSRLVLLVIGHFLHLGGSLARFAREPQVPVHVVRVRLLEKMAKAYRLFDGSVLCPTMIRDELIRTRELGAVWSNAAFAIVERAVRRDPSAWIAWPP